jgi:hypothetical protein
VNKKYAILKTKCGCKKKVPLPKQKPEEIMIPLPRRYSLSEVSHHLDDAKFCEMLFGLRRFRINRQLNERTYEYEEV